MWNFPLYFNTVHGTKTSPNTVKNTPTIMQFMPHAYSTRFFKQPRPSLTSWRRLQQALAAESVEQQRYENSTRLAVATLLLAWQRCAGICLETYPAGAAQCRSYQRLRHAETTAVCSTTSAAECMLSQEQNILLVEWYPFALPHDISSTGWESQFNSMMTC